jgi:hypothetical protein
MKEADAQQKLFQEEEEVEEQSLAKILVGEVDLEETDTGAKPSRHPRNKNVGKGFGMPEDVLEPTPKRLLKSVVQARRSRRRYRSRAETITSFRRIQDQADEIEEDEEVLVPTRLVVCLKFSCPGTDKVQRILAGESTHGQAQTMTSISSVADASRELPATSRNDLVTATVVDLDATNAASAASMNIFPRGFDTNRSMDTVAPFERQWIDETKGFNMNDVKDALRGPDSEVSALPDSFNWFPEAVPVDALFPPGVPISAKEIMAFYPHHIRWKGVALRLVNNGYFGDAIIPMQVFFRDKEKHPLTITNINQFFRDVLKNEFPDVKVSSFQGKPDRNQYTEHLKPSRLLNGSRYGFVVPTFNDLLKGLVHIPTGLDARGLTQCLTWYLVVRDTFTPRLDLNVLHMQSLIRALRVPLKHYGPRNLDKQALQEWKEKGHFTKRRVEDESASSTADLVDHLPEQLKRSRVTINLKAGTVGVDVVVKLRHVLTIPYLTIGRMICKALEMGIEKAEARRASREARESIAKLETKEVEDTTEGVSQERETAVISSQEEPEPQGDENGHGEESLASMPTGYKIPKRKRCEIEDDAADLDFAGRISPATGVSGTPLAPRATSISERRNVIVPRPLTAYITPLTPNVGSASYYGPGPTTASAPLFGHQRSHAPDHYHLAPYSSTFSGRCRLPPYTSTFNDIAPGSYYRSRINPGWEPVDNHQHQFDNRRMASPRDEGYQASANTETHSRNTPSGPEYNSRRER